MKRVIKSNEKANAAQQLLHELAKMVAPEAVIKIVPINPVAKPKLKPESRLAQAPIKLVAVNA